VGQGPLSRVQYPAPESGRLQAIGASHSRREGFVGATRTRIEPRDGPTPRVVCMGRLRGELATGSHYAYQSRQREKPQTIWSSAQPGFELRGVQL